MGSEAWQLPRQLTVYAEKLIGLRSEMMAEVSERSARRGVLRLGVAETIVHTWLSASPDTVAVELAGKIARSSAMVDVPPPARH
jgi:hypothetical protein